MFLVAITGGIATGKSSVAKVYVNVLRNLFDFLLFSLRFRLNSIYLQRN